MKYAAGVGLSDFLKSSEEGSTDIVDLASAVAVAPDDADFFADMFGTPFSAEMTATKRGPGRPKGAKNRTTAQMRRLLMANYRDPLLGVMDITAMTPNQIAREFHLKGKDAATMWMWAISKALEYLHQKQPTAVIVAGAQFHNVSIDLGGTPAIEAQGQWEAGINSAMNSIGYKMTGRDVVQEPSHE